jgi:predicted Zn-dependent peptidase
MYKNRIIISLLILIFVSQTILSAQSTKKIQELPKGVSIHQLDNGIKVLLIENPALPMIGVNTVVKVGSAYETFMSSGMSHMLEHLLFNGTTKWNQRELYDITDKIGGYNNANTSEYYTNYMMVTPTATIKEGMEIQAGMLFDSVLPEKNFQKEKGIVLEEIAKSLADPEEQAHRNVIDILYAGHALSLPTLGTYETIKGMDRDFVYDFYKNNYVPNNMLMSVIGNFKTSEMLKLLKEVYGKAAPGNVERPNMLEWGTGFAAPKSETKEKISHRFYKGKNSLLQHFYKLENHTVDFYSLLDISLNKQKEKIESKLKKDFPDQVQNIEFTIHSSPIGSFLEAKVVLNSEDKISEISNSFDKELKKANLKLSNDVVEAEAVKSKSEFLRQIEKPHMFGIYNAELIAQNGLGAIINAFSGKGIIEAGNELKDFKIKGEARLIIQHPSNSDVTEETNEIKVELFENGKTKSVVIAKQNSASELLAIHYMIKYKANFEAIYGKDAAKKWHNAFGNRLKTEANQKKSAKYGLSYTVNDIPFLPMDDIYLSPTFGYIRVEGLATDVKGAIEFLNKEMLEFVPTEEEFNKVNKSGMPAMMMRGGKDKSNGLYKKAYETLLQEPVKQNKMGMKPLTYQQFLEFGKAYFTPANMIISVVSKEKPATVNSYFANFASSKENKFNGLAKERGFQKWNEPKKDEQNGGGEQSHTFYGFVKDYDKTDEAPLTILSLMLKDDLIFNIREKQGLAYRMSAGIKKANERALIYIDVPTQPQNVEKLVPQFPSLFTPSFAEKITADKLEKTVNMYLGKMMFRRLSSINQAYYLAHSYYFNGDINADENYLDALKNVKLEDVKRVAKKYLEIENPVEIIIH